MVLIPDYLMAEEVTFSNSAAKKIKTIILNPGHGGYDTGVIGVSGTNEKTVTLKLCQLIKKDLSGDYRVLLTRNGDFEMNSQERCGFADRENGDLFISIHTGGAFSRSFNEMAVFYDDRKTVISDETKNTSEQWSENWDALHGKYEEESRSFGGILLTNLNAMLSKIDKFDDGYRKTTQMNIYGAPLFALNGCNMPGVILEIGRLSTPYFETVINNEEKLLFFADAVCDAIKDYFKKSSDK